MKKLAIFMALLLFQTQLSVYAAAKKKPVAKKTVKVVQQQPKQPTQKLYSVYDDSNYLLKYNIDDLDAAPWKNGGKRKI